MSAQFPEKSYGSNLTRGKKVDYGVNYEDEPIRGFIENLFHFSKRQVRKSTNVERGKSHGKILNETSDHSTVPKQKSKWTSLKRKRGSREPNNFIHFKDDTKKH